MRDPHNNPTFSAILSGGIDSSDNEKLEAIERIKKGTLKSLINGRTTLNGVDQNRVSKIEEPYVFWDRDVDANDYFTAISTGIGNNLFEMVFDKTDGVVVFFINDAIVLRSDIGYDYNTDKNNIQYDINSRSSLGEIYITNGRTEPMVFSLLDLFDNRATEKYFSLFDKELYSINSQSNTNIIVFNKLVPATTGGGLAWGQYSYEFRYVSKEGASTSWSFPTNLIPIIKSILPQSSSENVYGPTQAYIRNTAGMPAPEFGSGIGIEIKFRIDNKIGYDYIELKRTDYKRGEGLGFAPQSKIIKKIKIEPGQFSVYKYIDSINEDESHTMIDKNDVESSLSAIKSAKAIKYENNKLFLGGIEHFSRVVKDEEFSLVGEETTFHFMADVGRNGFSSAINCVNKRPLWHNEYYSWGVVFWDGNFRPSFVKSIAKSKRTPATREGFDTGTLGYIHSRAVTLTGLDNTEETSCADYIDNYNALAKPQIGLYGDVSLNSEIKNISTLTDSKGNLIDSFSAGYRPLRPTSTKDNGSSHAYSPIALLRSTDPAIPVTNEEHDFSGLKLFNPTIRSLGFGLNGIETYPSWAKAFSVVRTNRSGRIICQGLGFYNLVEQVDDGSGVKEETSEKIYKEYLPCQKRANSIVFQSPDIQNGVVDYKIFNMINSNPGLYKIELVKPLGFINEPHSGALDSISNGVDPPTFVRHTIDQVLHANIDQENDGRKIKSTQANPNTNGYVKFNDWFNSYTIGPTNFNSNPNIGNKQFGIISIKEEKIGNQDQSRIVITLDEDIYHYVVAPPFGNRDYFGDPGFYEPVYVVNIVSQVAEKSDSDYQEYQSTGNFVKFKSLIGVGSGLADQKFEIVDERLEDFSLTNENNLPGFMYVDELANGIYKRIINIKDLSAGAIVAVNDDIANQTSLFCGKLLDGKCTSNFSYVDKWAQDIYEVKEVEDVFIYFTEGYVPPEGSKIEVHYDKEKPVKVFGGDCFIGNHVYPILDRQFKFKSVSLNYPTIATEFFMNRGMPYEKFTFRDDYYQLFRAPSVTLGNILVPEEQYDPMYLMQCVRQMIVSYYCESVANINISEGSFYPSTNYVMRPVKSAAYTTAENKENIFPKYFEDYEKEEEKWGYGGFRTQQSPVNLDYSKEINSIKFYSYSELSFAEKTLFPTRIAASLTRAINQDFSENIKIFKSFNYYDLPDNNGAIKRITSFQKSGTSGLYAFMEDDIAIMLIDNAQIGSISGEQLALIGGDGVRAINSHVWAGEMDKKGARFNSANTIATVDRKTFFCNTLSAYEIEDGKVVDISAGFKNELTNELFSKIPYLNNLLSAFYNSREKEYWVSLKEVQEQLSALTVPALTNEWNYDLSSMKSQIINLESVAVQPTETLYLANKEFSEQKIYIITTSANLVVVAYDENYTSTLITLTRLVNTETCWELITDFQNSANTFARELTPTEYELLLDESKVFVYSDVKKSWVGKFTYNFDKFAKIDNFTFASKDGKAHRFEGSPKFMDLKLVANYNPLLNKNKEFKRIRIESSRLPTEVLTYNSEGNLHSEANVLLALADSYEGLIPVDADKKRLQGEFFTIEINDTDADQDISLQSLEFSFKKF